MKQRDAPPHSSHKITTDKKLPPRKGVTHCGLVIHDLLKQLCQNGGLNVQIYADDLQLVGIG